MNTQTLKPASTMDESIKYLFSVDNADGVEVAVDKLSALCNADVDLSAQVSSACERFLREKSDICNAKGRRKISRLIERLQVYLKSPSDQSSSDCVVVGEDHASSLKVASTIEDIEQIIVQISAVQYDQYPKSQIEDTINSMQSTLDRSDLTMNAKLRRRINRLIQMLSEIKPVQDLTAKSEKQKKPQVVQKLSIPETTKLLQEAATVSDVETGLNTMDLSILSLDPAESSNIRGHVIELRSILKSLMGESMVTKTNKKLRHRIKKTLYVLEVFLTGKKPEKLVKPVKPDKPATVNGMPPFSLSEILEPLAKASNDGEIVSALKSIPGRAEDLLTFFGGDLVAAAAVKCAIDDACNQCGESIAAKGRRKISRITSALDSLLPSLPAQKKRPIPTASVDEIPQLKPVAASPTSILSNTIIPENEEKEGPVKKKPKKAVKSEDPPAGPSQEEKNRKANEFLSDVVAKLRASKTSSEVEAALVGVGGESGVDGNFANRRAMKRVLTKLLEGGADVISLTSNARRKAKRALDGLEVASEKRSAQYGWKISSEKSSNKSDDSSSDDEVGASASEGEEEGGLDSHADEEDDKASSHSSGDEQVKKSDDFTKRSGNKIKALKFRLFFGQLSFSTTESDIRDHIAKHGITCDVRIRMLTKQDSGESRGAAFVDVLGGKRSLKRFMGMHHTMLNGRRINVERTVQRSKVAGADDATGLAINKDRIKNKIAHSETIDRLLTKYSETGIADKGNPVTSNDFLMNRLYALSVGDATKVLDDFKQQVLGANPKSMSKEDLFRNILHSYDNGGHAVDQAMRDTRIRTRKQVVGLEQLPFRRTSKRRTDE